MRKYLTMRHFAGVVALLAAIFTGLHVVLPWTHVETGDLALWLFALWIRGQSGWPPPQVTPRDVHLVRNLAKVARTSLGAYDALQAVGADKHLPGFARCLQEAQDAVREAEGAGL